MRYTPENGKYKLSKHAKYLRGIMLRWNFKKNCRLVLSGSGYELVKASCEYCVDTQETLVYVTLFYCI
jgi:hypothetical protein